MMLLFGRATVDVADDGDVSLWPEASTELDLSPAQHHQRQIGSPNIDADARPPPLFLPTNSRARWEVSYTALEAPRQR